MNAPSHDQVARLTVAFERFVRRFKIVEAAAAIDNSLNALDVQALLYIHDHPGCGLSDVAQDLQVALTTMSTSANRLVRKGMIHRERPEDDRRAVALTVTAEGERAVADHMAGYREACRTMLLALDATERHELVRLTEKIEKSQD